MSHLTAPDVFPGGADDAHDLVYVDGHLFVAAQNSHSLVVLRAHGEKSSTRSPLRRRR